MSAIITNQQITKFFPFVFQNSKGEQLALDDKGVWTLKDKDGENEVMDNFEIISFIEKLGKESTEAFNKQNK